MSNHFYATMKFTHGEIKAEGTVIFVLATINEQSKRDGFISVKHSPELEEELAAATARRKVLQDQNISG